ncbi:MAG: ribosome assembly RNA-binding protein YhbY [Proteobacteria bacterium]|nr:ribosome assembly RNA-binding protein YhbY [Pseudomonadota bacterium]MBU1060877.1 ribosome assembly RNA-binding protein YhbY [Pseudomonadota bacterium]
MTTSEEKKTAPELNAKQKKFLKGLGHDLTPVVAIGKEGLGEKIVKATALELSRHELIKIKVGKNSPVSCQETAESLSIGTGSSLVQIIGKTILLYKKNTQLEKDKRIRLP